MRPTSTTATQRSSRIPLAIGRSADDAFFGRFKDAFYDRFLPSCFLRRRLTHSVAASLKMARYVSSVRAADFLRRQNLTAAVNHRFTNSTLAIAEGGRGSRFSERRANVVERTKTPIWIREWSGTGHLAIGQDSGRHSWTPTSNKWLDGADCERSKAAIHTSHYHH